MTKYSLAALVCLSALYSQHVIAFAPSSAKTSSAPKRISTELHGAKKVAGICTSFLAGLGAAAQIAIADPNILETNNQIIPETQSLKSSTSSSVLLSAFGAPTGIGGASFETLDFSLPSYGEVTGSSDPSPSPPSTSKPLDIPELKSIAPKFEIKEEKKEEPVSIDVPPAAPKPKVGTPSKPLDIPELKSIAPKFEIKEEKKKEPVSIDTSDAPPAIPSIDLPKSDAPPATPSLPKFDAPKISAPSIDLKFSAPLPKFDAPPATPSIPKFDAPPATPSIPKFDAPPAAPKPKAETPKYSTDISAPSVSAPPAVVADEVNIEPQEVRDERAREAKATFVGLDNSAKDLEKQAKAARAEANAAKKEAGKAKDEACKTRFGGKLLCVRPFGIGY